MPSANGHTCIIIIIMITIMIMIMIIIIIMMIIIIIIVIVVIIIDIISIIISRRPCKGPGIDSFNADSDVPTTIKRKTALLCIIRYAEQTLYTHTPPHKHIQCAQAYMPHKPAHSDCIAICGPQPSITHYRCSYKNIASHQRRSVSHELGQQAPSPCGSWVILHSRYLLQIELQGTPPCQCDTHAYMHSTCQTIIISISRQWTKAGCMTGLVQTVTFLYQVQVHACAYTHGQKAYVNILTSTHTHDIQYRSHTIPNNRAVLLLCINRHPCYAVEG